MNADTMRHLGLPASRAFLDLRTRKMDVGPPVIAAGAGLLFSGNRHRRASVLYRFFLVNGPPGAYNVSVYLLMKRLSAQERRRKIIQAAVTLFSEKGFAGTTTKELARKAGISEALLFRHFPDKKKLYQAILTTKMEEQIPALFDGFLQKGDLREILRELAFRIARQNAKDSSFMKLLLFSALEGHELSDLFFQRRTLPLVEFLKKHFRKEIQKRRLKGHDPDLAARAFLAMVFGFVQTRNLFRIPQLIRRPVEKTLGTYVKIFLEGIEK